MEKTFWLLEDIEDEVQFRFEVLRIGKDSPERDPPDEEREGMGLGGPLGTHAYSEEPGVIWSTGIALSLRLHLQSQGHKLMM